jgi:hypothetical protein
MKTIQIQRPSFSSQVYTADIEPRQSIRLYGVQPDRCRYIPVTHDGVTTLRQEIYEQPFDLTFRIGDSAVYGSYNLTYTGKIISIGEKTVAIDAHGTGERKKRLDLWSFAWQNWDYDATKIAHDNAIESQYI